MPEARFELARGCPRWIWSPLRLPFRHSGARERYSTRALCGSRTDRASCGCWILPMPKIRAYIGPVRTHGGMVQNLIPRRDL